MDQRAFAKRLYAIMAVGACGLMALVLAFMKGGLSQQGFAVAVLIWWIAMFAVFFPLIRSRQRSARAEALDREQCVKAIGSLKKLIAMFAVFLGYGLLATWGEALLPRAIGATVNVVLLSALVHALIRALKRLKQLPRDGATER